MVHSKPRKYAIPRDYVSVGVFFKNAREAAGLTQREVQMALGYSSSQFISNFECGISVPPLNKMKALAELLDVKVEEMLDVILKAERARMLSTIHQSRPRKIRG